MKNPVFILIFLLSAGAAAQPVISLEALLDTARERNADVRLMESRYQQAQALPGPVSGINATNVSLSYGQIDGPDDEDYQIQIQQPLGNPVKGIYEKQKKNKQVELAATELKLQEAYLEMALKKAYGRWSSAFQKLKLAELQKQYFERATASAKRRFETKEISLVEWGLSQSKMLAVKEKYAAAFSEFTDAREQLEGLCLKDLKSFEPADSLQNILSIANPNTPEAKGLQQQRYEAQQEVAESELKVAGAALAPSFSVGYFTQQLQGVSGYQGFLAGVSIPLVQVRNYKERQIARLEMEQAELSRENQNYQLARQIDKLESQRQVLGEQLFGNEAPGSGNLDQSIASALRLYESGEMDFIQLAQVLDNLVDGYSRQQDLYYRYFAIVAELEYLTR